jgi:hypothetical protein
VVLDEDADEALHRADDGPVQHDRRAARGILVDVFGAEAPGIMKSTCIVPSCQVRPIASLRWYSIFGP